MQKEIGITMSEHASQFIFDPAVQNAFWAETMPDTVELLNSLEAKEEHTHHIETSPKLFSNIAKALPDVACLPISRENREIVVSLIPVLASMPLKSSIFAMHWLNERANSAKNTMGWGTLSYLEALDIVNNQQDHEYYDLAQVMIDRVTLIMRVQTSISMFSQWPSKNGRA